MRKEREMRKEGVNRRGFLGSGASFAAAALASGQAGAQRPGGAKGVESGRTIAEKPRRTPIVREVDVLVVGSGPAGVGAALAAASEGARVLLLERHQMLGGVWTAGMMNPLFNPEQGWMMTALVNRLKKAGAWRAGTMYGSRAPVYDVELMKYVLECMMQDAKIEFWYHAFVAGAVVEGDRVLGALVESKSGREAVLAKVAIDCSGDGDLAAYAGVPFSLGREQDGLSQPLTLMFEIDNIESFANVKSVGVGVFSMYDELQQAIRDSGLPIKLPYGPQRNNHAPYLISVPRPGAAVLQGTHVYKFNATNVRDMTKAVVERETSGPRDLYEAHEAHPRVRKHSPHRDCAGNRNSRGAAP